MHDAQFTASAIIDWNTLHGAPPPTILGDPQHGIEIHWYSAQTTGGVLVGMFVTNPQHPLAYYQNLSDPIDPNGNCHGETFGPCDSQGKRYNIYEGNVQDILNEGFTQVQPTSTAKAEDVVVWMEPNRTAAHSARVETVVYRADGQLDSQQSMLWTKNGLAPAQRMSLAEVHNLYQQSVTSSGATVQTAMEFWRAKGNP